MNRLKKLREILLNLKEEKWKFKERYNYLKKNIEKAVKKNSEELRELKERLGKDFEKNLSSKLRTEIERKVWEDLKAQRNEIRELNLEFGGKVGKFKEEATVLEASVKDFKNRLGKKVSKISEELRILKNGITESLSELENFKFRAETEFKAIENLRVSEAGEREKIKELRKNLRNSSVSIYSKLEEGKIFMKSLSSRIEKLKNDLEVKVGDFSIKIKGINELENALKKFEEKTATNFLMLNKFKSRTEERLKFFDEIKKLQRKQGRKLKSFIEETRHVREGIRSNLGNVTYTLDFLTTKVGEFEKSFRSDLKTALEMGDNNENRLTSFEKELKTLNENLKKNIERITKRKILEEKTSIQERLEVILERSLKEEKEKLRKNYLRVKEELEKFSEKAIFVETTAEKTRKIEKLFKEDLGRLRSELEKFSSFKNDSLKSIESLENFKAKSKAEFEEFTKLKEKELLASKEIETLRNVLHSTKKRLRKLKKSVTPIEYLPSKTKELDENIKSLLQSRENTLGRLSATEKSIRNIENKVNALSKELPQVIKDKVAEFERIVSRVEKRVREKLMKVTELEKITERITPMADEFEDFKRYMINRFNSLVEEYEKRFEIIRRYEEETSSRVSMLEKGKK